MIVSPLSRFSARFLFWSVVGLMFTNIALGQAEVPPAAAPSDAVPSQASSPAAEQSSALSDGLESVGQSASDVFSGMTGSGLPPKFTADGSPVELRNIGLTITPPQGWEVVTSDPSLTLIMQEPESKEVIYDKPLYRRNITVAKVAEPSPIDEQRAKQLKEELTETFGKQGGVANFQILEHKFFNYKGENDGLLVYTGFTMGENTLMQMHVLISNAQRQFLMTYTDFADRFQSEQLFNEAWTTIATAAISGEPPSRWTNLIVGIACTLAVIFGLFLLVFFRHRRATRMYMHDADGVYRDDAPSTRISSDTSWVEDASKENDLAVTQTGVWNLSGSNDTDDEIWDTGTTAHSTKHAKAVSQDGWNIHHKRETSEEGLSFVTNFR